MAFGDIRVAERADWLIDRMVAPGATALRRIGETRSGEMAAHRFLSSPYVSTGNIVSTCAARTMAQCRGRRILTVQDASEINFAGRDKTRRGFGPAGDGKAPGFFIHPVIAVDVETEAVIGLTDATIRTRRPGKSPARRNRPFEEKESARRLSGCTATAGMAANARPAMSSTTTSRWRSNGFRANSKARPPSRRILIRPDRSPSSHGSRHASADGIATMENQGQRPCASAGPNSQQPLLATPLLFMDKFRESRSPQAGRGSKRLMCEPLPGMRAIFDSSGR